MSQSDQTLLFQSLDARDRSLIEALRRNGRATLSELSRNLKMSRSTVQNRMTRLERRGVIAGYTVRLNPLVESGQLRAYVNVTIDPKATAPVLTGLRRLQSVQALYTVSGKIDFVALVRARSAEELETVVQAIGETQGVTGTETAIILSTKFDRS